MRLSAIGGRAAARALKIVAPLLPQAAFPSANGGQFWLLRLGLYELNRRKEQADDWVWMIDHTVQTGNGKCFVVLGIRLSDWNAKRQAALEDNPQASFAVEHRDLSVFAIEHMNCSTGVLVQEQLEQLSAKTGVTPCCILSDQGADVRLGAQLFLEQEDRHTVIVHDIAHAVACAVKRQLHENSRWRQFLADANLAKTRIRQTPYALLMPPELKNKARWMNLQPLIAWSNRILRLLDDPYDALTRAEVSFDLPTLEQKMGWLREYADSIAQWTTMMEAVAIVLKYIRNYGYHKQAHAELQALLTDFHDEPARSVVAEVLEFVRLQCEACGAQRVLGSTEVLESLIGKGKQLMGPNKNGYTKTVLAMAASVVDVTTDTIAAAFDCTKVRDVISWTQQKLGASLQAQRQRALCSSPSGTKPG